MMGSRSDDRTRPRAPHPPASSSPVTARGAAMVNLLSHQITQNRNARKLTLLCVKYFTLISTLTTDSIHGGCKTFLLGAARHTMCNGGRRTGTSSETIYRHASHAGSEVDVTLGTRLGMAKYNLRNVRVSPKEKPRRDCISWARTTRKQGFFRRFSSPRSRARIVLLITALSASQLLACTSVTRGTVTTTKISREEDERTIEDSCSVNSE